VTEIAVETEAPCHIPANAKELQTLVLYLYPDPGVIDILTLDQFIYRYRLSGLGAMAVADMERAQRITRTIGDHAQIGLAEFHIGLIHLYWQQYLGALPYFDDAQRHWQFAHNKYAVALAQFAQNAAYHHAYHYEEALTACGKASKTLTRLESSGVAAHPHFRAQLRECLNLCQKELITRIRRDGEGEPVAFHISIPLRDEHGDLPTQQVTAVSPSASPTITTSRTAVAPPTINLHRPAPLNTPVTAPYPPPPPAPGDSSEDDNDSPIPAHPNQSEHLIWYGLENLHDWEQYLPHLNSNSHLLIDTQIGKYDLKEGDLYIVNQAAINEEPPPSPSSPSEDKRLRRIFLMEVDENFIFTRDPKTEAVELFADHTYDIIGIVIGVWSRLNLAKE